MNTGFTYCPAACALAVAAIGSLSAQTISLNFGSNEPSGAIDTAPAANTAGALPISGEFWNNLSGAGGTDVALIDDAGLPAGTVTWTSANTWRTGSTGATVTSENGVLTKGYLDDGGGGPVITINSPFLLSDVYVIPATDGGGDYSALGINGAYYIGDGATTVSATSGQNWAGPAWSDADALTEGVNYVKALSQTGTVVTALTASPGRGSIGGVQIVNAYSGTLSYWDVDGVTPGAGDGGFDGDLNGIWDTDTFWSTSAAGDVATAAWTSGNGAVFSAGIDGLSAHDITITTSVDPDAVWVQEGAITLNGGILDLSAGTGLLRDDDLGLIVNSQVTAVDISTLGYVELNSATNAITGDVNVSGDLVLLLPNTIGTLSGTGNVTIFANPLVIGNANDGAFSGTLFADGDPANVITKNGAGNQSLGNAAPAGIDNYVINAGTLGIGAGDIIAPITGAGNLEKVAGGTLVLGSTANTGFTGNTTVSGGVLRIPGMDTLGNTPGAPTADALTLQGGGRLQGGDTGAGMDLTIGVNRGITLNGGNAGFQTWSGFTTTVNSPMVEGANPTTLTFGDGGTTIVNGGSTHTGDTRVETGTVEINSVITSSDNFRQSGDSTLNIGTGADISTTRFVTSDGGSSNCIIGHTDGTLNITGNVNSNDTAASFLLAHWGSGGADTNYNMSGGTINSLAAHLSFGWDGLAYVNQTGGDVNLLGLKLANGRNNTAIYNLDGGTLNLGADGIIANAAKTVNLGGGVLGSLASWSSAQSMALTGTTGDASFAPSGGDTIALSGDLSGAAGLSVDGAGILALSGAGTYAGATAVNSGTLQLEGDATGLSAVTVAAGGALATGTPSTSGIGTVDTLSLAGGTSSTFRLDGDQLVVSALDGLSVTATHDINVKPAGTLSIGDVFPVIDYDGVIGGAGFAGFNLNALANPHYTLLLIDNTTNTTIDVELNSIIPLTWLGGSAWNHTNLNWDNGSFPDNFFTDDIINFDDLGATETVVVDNNGGANPILPATMFLNNTTASDFLFTGDAIEGTGGVVKVGDGLVTLANDNTFTGTIEIQDGTLAIGDGTSGSISNGAPVDLQALGTLALDLPAAATFDSNVANEGLVQINGANDYTVTTADGGVISGAGAMECNNTGIVTLAGRNSFSGGNTINSGTVILSGGGWGQSPAQGTGLFTVNSGATAVNWNAHSFGAGAVPGWDMVLNEGSTFQVRLETYTRDITMTGATIENYPGADTEVRGTYWGGSDVIVEDSAIQSVLSCKYSMVNGANTMTVNDPDTDFLVSGAIQGGFGLTKNGVGNLLSTAANTQSAALNVDAGTFTLGATGSLASSVINVAAGAELDVTAYGPGSYSLLAGQTVAGNGLVDGNIDLAGANVAPGASAGTLTVTGAATFGPASSYNWEIADWIGAAGTGFDTVVADSLDITSTTLDRFTVVIAEDALANFTEADTSFVIVSTTSGVTGFDPLNVLVDDTAFSGLGTWAMNVVGNDLVLEYTGLADPYLAYETVNNIFGAGADVDSDGDNIENGIEFVIGGVSDPSIAQDDSGLLPTSTTDATNLVYVYRRTDASAGNNPYVQYSADLATWNLAENGTGGVVIGEVDDFYGVGIDQVTVTIPRSLIGADTGFARLRVDIP